MNWLDREISWGVSIAEQRHLVGRIGELYTTLISNGRMATETNQAGYDVVSNTGERISVKTTTQSVGGHISFNANTLNQVDRVIVLFLNTEEMQIDTLLDQPIDEARRLLVEAKNNKLNLSLSKLRSKVHSRARDISQQNMIDSAIHKEYIIQEFESGTIIISKDNEIISPAKPLLRKFSSELHLPILNTNGNPMNTRQLGSRLIKELKIH